MAAASLGRFDGPSGLRKELDRLTYFLVGVDALSHDSKATLGLGGLDVTGLVGFARTGVFP